MQGKGYVTLTSRVEGTPSPSFCSEGGLGGAFRKRSALLMAERKTDAFLTAFSIEQKEHSKHSGKILLPLPVNTFL